MAAYSTTDYFRDSYWLFDKIAGLAARLKSTSKKITRKMLNFEFETYFLRIIENLPYGLMIIFLGFFFVVFLLRLTENGSGLKVYTITTASMSPAVSPGSLLFSYPEKRYLQNDIVTYKEKSGKNGNYTGRLLTHRILEVKVEDGFYIYTLKGDNNENPDPGMVKSADIDGKVFLILPLLGYIDFLIRTVPGFIIFIAVPTVILVREARRYALTD